MEGNWAARMDDSMASMKQESSGPQDSWLWQFCQPKHSHEWVTAGRKKKRTLDSNLATSFLFKVSDPCLITPYFKSINNSFSLLTGDIWVRSLLLTPLSGSVLRRDSTWLGWAPRAWLLVPFVAEALLKQLSTPTAQWMGLKSQTVPVVPKREIN